MKVPGSLVRIFSFWADSCMEKDHKKLRYGNTISFKKCLHSSKELIKFVSVLGGGGVR